MACSLAVLGHSSTDSSRDSSTPPMIPTTLVTAGNSNSAVEQCMSGCCCNCDLHWSCVSATCARLCCIKNERVEQHMYLDNVIPVGDSVVPNTTERNVKAVIFASDRDSSTTTLKKPIVAEHADRHNDSRKPSLLIL